MPGVRDDRGDGPRGLDIVRASYTNTGRDLGGVVKVRRLRRSGMASIQVVTSDGGQYKELNLYVRRRRDGTIRRWAVWSDYVEERVPCRVRGRWNGDRDRIPLFVDTRCLRNNDDTGDITLRYTVSQAWTFGHARSDSAPQRRVRRN